MNLGEIMTNTCNHEMSSFTGKCCFCGKTKKQIEGKSNGYS